MKEVEEKAPYSTCESCGAKCDSYDPAVCYGPVEAVDEIETEDGDWVWVHYCQFHGDNL